MAMAHYATVKKNNCDQDCFLFTLNRNAHIPGYTGHCPFLRDTFGETFSASTWAAHVLRRSQLSKRSKINSPRQNCQSQRACLPNNGPGLIDFNKPETDDIRSYRTKLDDEIENRRSDFSIEKPNRFKKFHDWTNEDKYDCGQLYLTIPAVGYCGHIPRLQVTSAGIGLGFTEAARISIALFQRELALTKSKWQLTRNKKLSETEESELAYTEVDNNRHKQLAVQ